MTITDKYRLFSYMQQGAVIVTPNQRLSQQLISDFYRNTHKSHIAKPRCFSYLTFIQELFKYATHKFPYEPHPHVLSSHQQHHLWYQLLQQSDEINSQQGLLTELIEAWRRCQQWQLSMEHPLFQHTAQWQQFQTWHHQFQQQLDDLHALTPEQIIPYLSKLYTHDHHFLSSAHIIDENEHEQLPLWYDCRTVIWACFDDEFPLLKQLQQRLRQAGHQQYHYELAAQETISHRSTFIDEYHEWQGIAHWLKTNLSQGKQNLAVIVPDLQTQYRTLRRFLLSHFNADMINFSLGMPLMSYPLVAHAYHGLALGHTLTHATVKLILHSPFIGHSQQEWLARMELDQHPLLQEEFISKSEFCKLLKQKSPKLARCLAELIDYPDKASIAEWTNLFKARLRHLCFPGEYPLDSEAYQCFQRLMGILDEFFSLSLVCDTSLTSEEALTRLHNMAQHTIFQAKTSQSPIQVLGLLEASGCLFDAIWVCGLTDSFPQKVRLSAFIPVELQKKMDMPHANHHREWQFAKQILTRIIHASPQCVFSYAQFREDIHQAMSPLLLHFPSIIKDYAFIPEDNTSSLQAMTETYSHPLAITAEPMRGGTSLLANQAQCPFRAFAIHRLHAHNPTPASRGLNASERGQLLHHILEIIWRQLQHQKALLALSPYQLTQLIEHAILEAFQPWIQQRPTSFPILIQDVELKRLQHLIETCLQWEKTRPSFVVEAIEKTDTIELAGLTLQVRMDRLDRSEDTSEKWIIDYKTSIPSIQPWYDERPEAPQLLLYALIDPAINVLLFIELKKGKLTCSGLSEHPNAIKEIRTVRKELSWRALQTEWELALTALADEFRRGHCEPMPNRQSTCVTCEYKPLCRTAANHG